MKGLETEGAAPPPLPGLPLGTVEESPEVSAQARGIVAPRDIPGERFEIHDESTATWYLRKVAGIDAEIERVKAATLQRLEELQADRNGLTSRFQSQLESWARGEAEKRRRRTVTIPLAGVQVAFRATSPKIVLEPQKAAEIAFTLGFVTPPGEPVADLKAFQDHATAYFAETGELLPGVRRTEGGESVSVGPIKARKKGEVPPEE